MNERIKELSKQATNSVSANFRGADWQREYEKKFAELIVRECVDIVAKRKDRAIDDGWNVDEAMSIAEFDLKEHFGVE